MTPDNASAVPFEALFVLVLWFGVCVAMMNSVPPLRATVWGYLGAMLLLPTGRFVIPALPDIDKWQMAGLGLTAGALLFRFGMIRHLRLAVTDWLLLAFMASTGVTSLVNGLGLYDAFSTVLRMYLVFGAPYLLMRVFCRTGQDILYVVGSIVAAAAIYVIPAVWEFRMSPQLHRAIWGYSDQGWREHYRHGFYRPLLFFEHGIPLGFFFATASIVSLYMYLRGVLRPVWRIPAAALAGLTTLGTLISMTYGAYFAWALALGTLMFAPRGKWRYLALLPMLVAVGWSAVRYTDSFNVHGMIALAYQHFDVPRAQSFEYRLLADDKLLARAREAPFFGWGGWGRNRGGITDQYGNPIALDALWVDTVGKYGLVGISLFYAWFMAAAVRGIRCLDRIPSPALHAAAYALAVMTGIELINWQLNGFVNPTVLLGAAMLTTLAQLTRGACLPAAARSGNLTDGRLGRHPQLQHARSAAPLPANHAGQPR